MLKHIIVMIMEKIKRIILRKKEPEWLKTDMILSQFGGRDGHKAYREKVQNYAEEEGRLWEDFRHGVVLGSAGFVESIRSLKGDKSPGYLVVEAELPPGAPPGRELRARRTAHPIFALTVLQSECIISAMWIERHISETLQKAAAQFPVVVLTGARQAGKTSLVRRQFPQADYVTFDIPRDAEAARMDFPAFLIRHREPLIIDEVQYVPEILRRLKVVVDRDRRPGRFLLTGSQDFSVMQGVAESLAGRCAVLSLSTLSLAEVAVEATVEEADMFCWRGGFP